MANTPEGKVKDKIKKMLNTHNCYITMPIGTGFGCAGVPDYLVCINGHFLGIEAKAGKNKPTALQEKHMTHIRECGGHIIVVNEGNFDELEKLLKDLS
jgi:hypothetical protein